MGCTILAKYKSLTGRSSRPVVPSPRSKPAHVGQNCSVLAIDKLGKTFDDPTPSAYRAVDVRDTNPYK